MTSAPGLSIEGSKMARYREFKGYLESIGFVEESVKNSHFAFFHQPSDTIILLAEMGEDSTMSQVDIVSARRHLVDNGLVSDEEFAAFLRTATKASKKHRS
jgi:predicted RNA binding protein YcfA (HicA-like mRNA interferase family)